MQQQHMQQDMIKTASTPLQINVSLSYVQVAYK